jgi:hypothetical protein
MKTPTRQGIMLITGIIVIFGLSLSIQSIIAAAWQAPSAAPPANNLYELINESASGITQTIIGRLDVTEPLNALNGFSADGNTLHVDYLNDRVGMGTDIPSGLLSIYSDDNPGPGDETEGIILQSNDGGVSSYIYHNVGGDLVLRKDANANQLVLDTAGNVGVGVAAPTVKLEVDGKIQVTAGNDVCLSDGTTCLGTAGGGFWLDTNTPKIHYDAGNVGIGVADPSVKLEVNGNIQAATGFDICSDGGTTCLNSIVAGSFWQESTAPNIFYDLGNVEIGDNVNKKEICLNDECIESWPLNELSLYVEVDFSSAACEPAVAGCVQYLAECDPEDLVVGGDCKMQPSYARDVVGDMYKQFDSDKFYRGYMCYYYGAAAVQGARVLCLDRAPFRP